VSKTPIPADEVDFHPHSFGDPDGRLFRWNGRLYRALRGERAGFFDELVRSGTIEQLARESLLVETEPTDLALDGYTSVFLHRDVPFPSYPIEWSPTMFRDAALLYIRLVERLFSLGLTLKDVHPWNIVFDFTRPLYVDLTSLTPLENGLPAAEKVARYYLRPLLLMERGGERIARSLLFDYESAQATDLELLGVPAVPGAAGDSGTRAARIRFLFRGGSRAPDPGRVAEWRRVAEAVKLPDDGGSRAVHAPTSRTLTETVRRIQPASVLLLQGDGDLAVRAAAQGSDVVVLEESSTRVTSVYLPAKKAGARVLPLVLDFSRPTPSIGFSGHYSVAAADRLQCDLLAVHGEALRRLLGDRSLPCELVAEGFCQFAGRWLAVERESWSEALEAALRPRFGPPVGDLGDGRVVLLEKTTRR
jgi:hypothetical protein